MTPEEAKALLTTQLTDLAKTTGEQVADDLKEYIADGKHEDMKELAVRAMKLKAGVLMAKTPDERRELAEDLEFALARIATKIETEKIVLSKTIGATVMSALKTALSAFASVGSALVTTVVKGAIQGAVGGLGGGAIGGAIGDALSLD